MRKLSSIVYDWTEWKEFIVYQGLNYQERQAGANQNYRFWLYSHWSIQAVSWCRTKITDIGWGTISGVLDLQKSVKNSVGRRQKRSYANDLTDIWRSWFLVWSDAPIYEGISGQ